MQATQNIKEFAVFHADVKKMTDAQLEASLKELRDVTNSLTLKQRQPTFRRRAA